MDVVVVLTTTADDASAAALARALVEERLAACVTRMAARSVYRWEKPGDESDEVCEEQEVLLVIKSARFRLEELQRRILELHGYDCPEIVVLDPEAVEPRYRAWLLAACSPGGIGR
jgi:periplasmic divalent cation tolerance protein